MAGSELKEKLLSPSLNFEQPWYQVFSFSVYKKELFIFKAAEEDSGTETDDETGGPDEGKEKTLK